MALISNIHIYYEGPQRFLDVCIQCAQCVGTAIVTSFFNKVADDWIKTGSTVQVRLPSASSMHHGVRCDTASSDSGHNKEDAGVWSSTGR